MLRWRSLKYVQRDILGVILAIFGAVTIVGAGKSSDVRVSKTLGPGSTRLISFHAQLDHAALIRAISRRPFVVYAGICVMFIVIFGVLSAGHAGRKYVFVDVGLCALFGGSYASLSHGPAILIRSLRRWIHSIGNQSRKHSLEFALD
jgi:magnesium transporter